MHSTPNSLPSSDADALRRTNPWTDRTAELRYDNPWITVTHRNVTTPTGSSGIYGLVHFKHLAVGVIPIDDDDHTWLVGQYRYPTDRWSWEIPEGGGRLDEDPAEAARRELEEECGIIAAHLEPLGSTQMSNSVTDEISHLFVATGLSSTAPRPDETEVLEVRRVPVDEAIALVHRGVITDGLSMVGLLLLAERRRMESDSPLPSRQD